MDLLLGKLNQLRENIEQDLKARSPLKRYEEAEEEVRDKWESELAAAIEAEYKRQRADLLALIQWWLRDVWLLTLKTPSASAEALMSFPQLPATPHVARSISCREGPRQPPSHRTTPTLAQHQCPGGPRPRSQPPQAPPRMNPVPNAIRSAAPRAGRHRALDILRANGLRAYQRRATPWRNGQVMPPCSNPKGVVQQSPGLAPRQPWVIGPQCRSTPTGLRPGCRKTTRPRWVQATTPLGLTGPPARLPRVVPPVQPWALFHNRVAAGAAHYLCSRSFSLTRMGRPATNRAWHEA